MKPSIIFWCAALVVASATLSAAGQAERERDLLRNRGIEPTVEGITKYLGTLDAAYDAAQISRWVAQLGDDDYKSREEATNRLIALPQLPEKELKEALQSKDPEVVVRVQRVLEESQAVPMSTILQTVFVVVQERKLKVSAVILANMKQMPPDVHTDALAAVAATVTPEDEKPLRELMKSPDLEIRIRAIGILRSMLKEKFDADMQALLNDSVESVQMLAVEDLAAAGNRACLERLGKQLSSNDPTVRYRSVQLLRALTGQDLPFVPYEEKPKREVQAEAWRKWIGAEGGKAKLNHPLKFLGPEAGPLLLCISQASGNCIVEVDDTKKETVLVKLETTAWGVQRVGKKNVLVSSFGDKAVREYNDKGQVIWKLENLPAGPMRALRLENGNTLIAGTDSRQVWEYNGEGRVVWSHTFDQGRVCDARRLSNGNTLICLHKTDNGVVEVDAKGKVMWQMAVSDPQSAQRLENGNTLVCQSTPNDGAGGRVAEYNKKGDVVWSYRTQLPLDAMRLPNGNTLVVDQYTGAVEVDAKGKVVWEHKRQGGVRLWR